MILDDRTYGIQAFDTPEEAFGLMASNRVIEVGKICIS